MPTISSYNSGRINNSDISWCYMVFYINNAVNSMLCNSEHEYDNICLVHILQF